MEAGLSVLSMRGAKEWTVGSIEILLHVSTPITNLPTQHSVSGHHRPASETGGQMVASALYTLYRFS